jgi:hypothetical protein
MLYCLQQLINKMLYCLQQLINQMLYCLQQLINQMLCLQQLINQMIHIRCARRRPAADAAQAATAVGEAAPVVYNN